MGKNKQQMQRNYRDTVFHNMLSDKLALAEIHYFLTGEEISPEEVEITTADGVFFGIFKNDISFSARNVWYIFLEQQSTENDNMPIRLLEHVAHAYDEYLSENDRRRKLYGRQMIKLPAPVFVVFYNGDKEMPEESYQKLSTAFAAPSDYLELKVRWININYEKGAKILRTCQTLRAYSAFVGKVKENKGAGMNRDEAIREAMSYCIHNNLAAKYFKAHEKEVFSMMSFVYDEEYAKKVLREDSFAEGQREKTAGMVERMLKKSRPLSEIMEFADASKEFVLSVAKEKNLAVVN